MTDSQVETEGATTSRRAMIAGVGAVGASALLAACGTDDGDDSLAGGDDGGTQGAAPAATTPAAAPTTGKPAEGGAENGTKLASTGDIPTGGGKIFKDKQVVVTQPAKGKFKAFNTICPHQGCDVSTVKSGTINCPCHGSQFSVEDGSVKQGPATKGLTEVTVKVNGGSVWLT